MECIIAEGFLYSLVTLNAFKILCTVCFIVFIIIPMVFKYSYKLQQTAIFANFVNIPINPNYTNPSKYGLRGSRNFYIESDKNIKLGVWHILPENHLHSTINDEKYFETVINDGQNVIIYNHGNSGSRAASHRIELYQILRKHFHIIAFDYRGYGDSSNVPPTENGLVRDCISVYKWVMNKTSAKIFIWGHSLGTGLTTHMLSILNAKNIIPSGVILESPFTNMRDEISEYPLSKILRPFPWFHYTIVEPLQSNNFIFASDKHILNVDCPILILHAEDDGIVPYKLGYKLYDIALTFRKPKQGRLQFVGFPKMLGYGHKYICRAPELSSLVKNFVAESLREMEEKHML